MKTARWAAALLSLPLLPSACSENPTVVPTRNLNRPSDLALACLGLLPGGFTGVPMAGCHPGDAADPPQDQAHRTYGFLTNTARGELAVIEMDRGRLVDLDPGAPGFNLAPVGPLPESIAASSDGCRLLTANRGACDLTLVDPARLVGPTLSGVDPKLGPGPALQKLRVRGASGVPIHAHPHEVVFLPEPDADLKAQTEQGQVCRPEGAYRGPETEGGPLPPRAPWRALVTFPGCDLVAAIEVPSGRIVSSAYIRGSGIVLAGDDPVCAVECGADGTPAVAPDGGDAAEEAPEDAGGGVDVADTADGAADGAGPPDGGAGDGGAGETPADEVCGSARLQVGAMALLPGGERVYVGGSRSPCVTALDVDGAGRLSIPRSGGRIPLHGGAIGTSRLRLSVDPIASGRGFVGMRGQFLYALAEDGTVRVIDVGRRTGGDETERECDVNVDPLAIPSADLATGCFAIDDPAFPLPPRRPLARGPGLRLPLDTVPRDVTFASIHPKATTNGGFGYITTSNGGVVLVELDPLPRPQATDGRLAELYVPLTHSLRDVNAVPMANGLGPSSGHARVDLPPSRPTVDPAVALAPSAGPRLEAIYTADQIDNPRAPPDGKTPVPTWAFFPDRSAVTGQVWGVAWEALLAETSRASGVVSDPPSPQGPAVLSDSGARFCHSGVVPGDILVMSGCRDDGDCGLGETCVHATAAPRGVTGLCLNKDARKVKELAAECERFLLSERRYRVAVSHPRSLEVEPLIDEVPRPSIKRCEADKDCQPDAAHMKMGAEFKCLAVRDGEARRCVQPCTDKDGMPSDAVCRAGRVCEDAGSPLGPLCVDGPPLSSKCFAMFSHYFVQAGRSFVVGGSALAGFDTARIEDNRCVDDTARHPLLRRRIPMDAPHCDEIPDGLAGVTDVGERRRASLEAVHRTPGPNPCLFLGINGDDSSDTMGTLRVKALFQNTEIRFVLTNLDQYFGDSIESRFQVSGGFRETSVRQPADVGINLPVRILASPIEAPGSPGALPGGYLKFPYLFLIDQGRAGPNSAHGKLLRINPAATSPTIEGFSGFLVE